MKVSELIELIDGHLYNASADLDRVVLGGCGADLMSDVLASVQPEAVLLTGLCNPQVIRTAIIADIHAIVFVRGKQPDKETLELANEEDVPLIRTEFGLYEACGILYNAGLPSFEKDKSNNAS